MVVLVDHTHTHMPHVCLFKRSDVCYFTHLHPNLPVNRRSQKYQHTYEDCCRVTSTSLEERGFQANPASVRGTNIFTKLITYKTIPLLWNAHPRTCFKRLMLFRWVRKLIWTSQSSWGTETHHFLFVCSASWWIWRSQEVSQHLLHWEIFLVLLANAQNRLAIFVQQNLTNTRPKFDAY